MGGETSLNNRKQGCFRHLEPCELHLRGAKQTCEDSYSSKPKGSGSLNCSQSLKSGAGKGRSYNDWSYEDKSYGYGSSKGKGKSYDDYSGPKLSCLKGVSRPEQGRQVKQRPEFVLFMR